MIDAELLRMRWAALTLGAVRGSDGGRTAWGNYQQLYTSLNNFK
ncbi:MAG TPA: hypothetical protein VM260_00725 [Pirellula sp.]|nr:hypothetical protein [Pirellula sp.]